MGFIEDTLRQLSTVRAIGLRKLPVMLQFHGGGFVSGSSDSVANDFFCRRIAKLSDVIVLAVGYRLPPENRYPAAFEDGWKVVNWLAKQANLAECSKSLTSKNGIGGGSSVGGGEAKKSDTHTHMVVHTLGASMVEPWAMSTVHAIFITALSIYLAFWSDLYDDDQERGPVLFRNSSLSTAVLGVSVGYFIADLAMILWFYPALGGIEYMLHHFLSMGALGYAMLTGLGQFYAYMVLLSETTTPGINLRWYLDTVGKKKSNTYVANGVAIFVTWLVARILLFMYVFYHIYAHYDQIKLLPTSGFYLILTAPSVLAVMNLIWFSKITKEMIKTITSKKDC